MDEKDALRDELARLEAAAPLSARETARYLEIERQLMAFEDGSTAVASQEADPRETQTPLRSTADAQAPAEMPGDVATALATQIMALRWRTFGLWTVEEQADRHGELQTLIAGALAPILAEKERFEMLYEGQKGAALEHLRHRQAAEAALAAERERCALIAANETIHPLGEQIAAAIRAGE